MGVNKNEYLLTCLGEECNEIGQRASKALRFGLAEVQPGQPLSNVERLAAELDDLMGVLQLLREQGVMDYQPNPARIADKQAKLRAFMGYSESLGTLQADHRRGPL